MVEVLIALTILGVAVAVLTTATLSSVRNTATSGSRTQATQVLSYLGRLVAGGDDILFQSEDMEWQYGQLGEHFTELARETGRADPALYRAEIVTVQDVTFRSVTMPLYRVNVCWLTGGSESCVSAETIGPEHDPVEENLSPLPGIS